MHASAAKCQNMNQFFDPSHFFGRAETTPPARILLCFQNQRFIRASLETSLHPRVSIKHSHIGVVFETTLRTCEQTVSVLMPL